MKPNTISFYALFFGPLVLAICVNLVFFALVLKVIRNNKNAKLSDTEQIMVSSFNHTKYYNVYFAPFKDLVMFRFFSNRSLPHRGR